MMDFLGFQEFFQRNCGWTEGINTKIHEYHGKYSFGGILRSKDIMKIKRPIMLKPNHYEKYFITIEVHKYWIMGP